MGMCPLDVSVHNDTPQVFKAASKRIRLGVIVRESIWASMADPLTAQECARPVLPVMMLPELYSLPLLVGLVIMVS